MLNTPDAPSAGDEVAAEHPDRAIAALDHVVTRLLNHPMVSAETFDQGGVKHSRFELFWMASPDRLPRQYSQWIFDSISCGVAIGPTSVPIKAHTRSTYVIAKRAGCPSESICLRYQQDDIDPIGHNVVEVLVNGTSPADIDDCFQLLTVTLQDLHACLTQQGYPLRIADETEASIRQLLANAPSRSE